MRSYVLTAVKFPGSAFNLLHLGHGGLERCWLPHHCFWVASLALFWCVILAGTKSRLICGLPRIPCIQLSSTMETAVMWLCREIHTGPKHGQSVICPTARHFNKCRSDCWTNVVHILIQVCSSILGVLGLLEKLLWPIRTICFLHGWLRLSIPIKVFQKSAVCALWTVHQHTVYKAGNCISTSSHCTKKMKQKYLKYSPINTLVVIGSCPTQSQKPPFYSS